MDRRGALVGAFFFARQPRTGARWLALAPWPVWLTAAGPSRRRAWRGEKVGRDDLGEIALGHNCRRSETRSNRCAVQQWNADIDTTNP